MEVKKTKKADLEGQKTTALLIGFVVSLAVMYTTFEWTTHEFKDITRVCNFKPEENDNIEFIAPTLQVSLPTPPEVTETPDIAEILNIVENESEIEQTKIETVEDLNKAIPGPTAPTGTMLIAPLGPTMDNGETDDVFEIVEENPMFPGGDKELMNWLAKNIKYPAAAQENGIMGRVLISFVVNKDGTISEPKITRTAHPALDKEALRVISNMPRWKPGKQGNKPVRVKFTLPVTFRLS